MIVADRKSLEEILAMVEDCKKVLVVGCKGCVTVCNVGGLKEVEILSSSLKIARKKSGNDLDVEMEVLERQCDNEYVAQISETLNRKPASSCCPCCISESGISDWAPRCRLLLHLMCLTYW